MTSEEQGALPRYLRRAWGDHPAPGTRGRRASLSIDEIVNRAVVLADSDGMAAVSLVKLAASLEVTPNALYRYLESREELDVLLREYALAEPPTPDPTLPWQEAVKRWALLLRLRYTAHPWLADLTLSVPITPHALGWLESLLIALDSSPIPRDDVLRTAVLLDGYVREQFLTQRDLSAWSNDDTDPPPDITGVVSRLLEARGLDRVALLFREGSYNEPSDSTGDQNFAFGLDRIVLGLEAGASRGR